MSPFRIGIDASNLRAGGGLVHLVELIKAADAARDGFSRITIWGGSRTLARLPDRDWLDRVRVPQLDKALPYRLQWQRWSLDAKARAAGCNVLFIPGGTYMGQFNPMVAISQNLLPFDARARSRYGVSWQRLRLALLRQSQAATFRSADGMIFLTETARRTIESQIGLLSARVAVIPHGINAAFRAPARQPRGRADSALRILYVSTVDEYKNQACVVRAAALLRGWGIPVRLELVGSAYPPSLRKLRRVIAEVDPENTFVSYVGEVAHEALPAHYHAADVFVFASLCENLPNILLEAMAAALPIACSDRSVMPEVLGDAGLYFDPDSPASIAAAIRELAESPERRHQLSKLAHARARPYSWDRCARETFAFLGQFSSVRLGPP